MWLRIGLRGCQSEARCQYDLSLKVLVRAQMCEALRCAMIGAVPTVMMCSEAVSVHTNLKVAVSHRKAVHTNLEVAVSPRKAVHTNLKVAASHRWRRATGRSLNRGA